MHHARTTAEPDWFDEKSEARRTFFWKRYGLQWPRKKSGPGYTIAHCDHIQLALLGPPSSRDTARPPNPTSPKNWMRVSETRRGRDLCGRLLLVWSMLVRVLPRAAGVLRRLDEPAILSEMPIMPKQRINLKEIMAL